MNLKWIFLYRHSRLGSQTQKLNPAISDPATTARELSQKSRFLQQIVISPACLTKRRSRNGIEEVNSRLKESSCRLEAMAGCGSGSDFPSKEILRE
jgi:hypothetical protein